MFLRGPALIRASNFLNTAAGGACLDEILWEHYRRYSQWEAEDLLKLLYQRHCGCGHFAPAKEAAQARLQQEWAATAADPSFPLWEPIGGGYARLHLAAAKAAGIPGELILRIFCASAMPASEQNYRELEAALTCLQPEAMGISPERWQKCLKTWEEQGKPPVSHSQAYRDAYHPAYRVVTERFARWLPLLACVYAHMQASPKALLAIDGRCGSGKSDLAACLHTLFGAAVVHMDDFFLPIARKTPERLAQPGGNVDIERFCAEVADALRAGQTVRYRPYFCHTGVLGEAISLPDAALTVVEGAYSLHPQSGVPYTLRMFLSVPPQTQRQRILARNGEAQLQRFVQEWIPMEEAYFSAYGIASAADVCYDTQACRVIPPYQV